MLAENAALRKVRYRRAAVHSLECVFIGICMRAAKALLICGAPCLCWGCRSLCWRCVLGRAHAQSWRLFGHFGRERCRGGRRSQIKLSTKSFGTDAAEVAARGIANITSTLEEADLSDIIAGPMPREAAAGRAAALLLGASCTTLHPGICSPERKHSVHRHGAPRMNIAVLSTVPESFKCNQGVPRTRRYRRCASWRTRWPATRSCGRWTSATTRSAKRASAPSPRGSATRSACRVTVRIPARPCRTCVSTLLLRARCPYSTLSDAVD